MSRLVTKKQRTGGQCHRKLKIWNREMACNAKLREDNCKKDLENSICTMNIKSNGKSCRREFKRGFLREFKRGQILE
jgi:hypothetical protein